MKQSLHRRLAELERVCQARNWVGTQLADGSHLEKVRAILLGRGVEQSPTESLAEAFARLE